MKHLLLKTSAAITLLCLGGLANAGAPAAADLGAVSARGGAGDRMSITLSLRLRDQAGAESMAIRLATPGDALYHKFMTPAQIGAAFGADKAEIDRTIAALGSEGLAVERASLTTLKVTGTVAAIERVFKTEMHDFAADAVRNAPARTFRSAVVKPTLPASVSAVVQGAVGFDGGSTFSPHLRFAPSIFGARGAGPTGTPLGQLTPKDFDAIYNVNPLLDQGFTGAGRTLGIFTLAAFTPSDAEAYWQAVGINASPNRMTIVDVDGGPGAPSDASASSETTSDVEEAGGVAPDAKIIVYQAPNTPQGMVDCFAKAVGDNIVDSLSTSWGRYEFGASLQFAPVTSDITGDTVALMDALNELFIVGALQGQSLMAASGDGGAFDVAHDVPDPQDFTVPIGADSPASSPFITAVGGTTLPGSVTVRTGDGHFTATNPVERVWAWDYLEPACQEQNLSDQACGIFAVGGGGASSVYFHVPFYQKGLPGVVASPPGQSLVENVPAPPVDLFDPPANFAGRNTSDVVFNADPFTGYMIFYTSDKNGFEVLPDAGGTSAAAPMLNGATAVLGQKAGSRFGLLNIPLYALFRSGIGTSGPHPAIRIISAGDNWFYAARNGYSPGAGIGTLNFANLAVFLK